MTHVRVMYNTDAEGRRVDASTTDYDKPDAPVCIFGPFDDSESAEYWMSYVYPDGDTDVYDMDTIETVPTGWYVNPPSTHKEE